MNLPRAAAAALAFAAHTFLLVAASALAACSAADRAIASGVVGDVGAALPLVCQIVPASGASVCGTVTGDVGAVARLVQAILASLPPAMAATAAPAPHGVIRYRGCDIVLPPGVSVAAVAKGLP